MARGAAEEAVVCDVDGVVAVVEAGGVPVQCEIGAVAVGQVDVITRGNDTGAFGKCAPISYFSASVCGISTSARDSLETLQKSKDPRIWAASLEMEQLLTQVPMDEDNRIAIHASLRELKARATSQHPSEVAKINQLVENMMLSVHQIFLDITKI